MRSEYDYGSKKKFLDVLGNVSTATKLNRLRAQHEAEKESAKGGAAMGSIKSSRISRVSYKSKTSLRSQGGKVITGEHDINAHPETIQEEQEGPIDDDKTTEARPEDFTNCNICLLELSEDEKIISARFVNEALAAHKDISAFPVCIVCNYE